MSCQVAEIIAQIAMIVTGVVGLLFIAWLVDKINTHSAWIQAINENIRTLNRRKK